MNRRGFGLALGLALTWISRTWTRKRPNTMTYGPPGSGCDYNSLEVWMKDTEDQKGAVLECIPDDERGKVS